MLALPLEGLGLRHLRETLAWMVLVCVPAGESAAKATPDGVSTAAHILAQHGEIDRANFCPGAAAAAPCVVPAASIRDLLTGETLNKTVVSRIIRLTGVSLDGTLDLAGSEVTHGLELSGQGCATGRIDLTDAHLKWPIRILGCSIGGDFASADAAYDADLDVGRSRIAGEMNLMRARIGGYLLANSVQTQGTISLQGTTVAHNADLSTPEGGVKRQALAHNVNLTDVRIGGTLWMGGSVVASDITLPGASIGHDAALSGVRAAYVQADDSHVDGALRLDRACVEQISLQGAHVGVLELDNLMASDATAGRCTYKNADVEAANIEVRQRLSGWHMAARKLRLPGALIALDVELSWARIDGEGRPAADNEDETPAVDFTNATIGGYLTLPSLVWGDTTLESATIKGDAHLDGSHESGQFHGKFNASGITVGGSVFMMGATYHDRPDLTLAHVANDIDISGATMRGILLDGSNIGDELRLWPKSKQNTELISLKNVKAQVLAGSCQEPSTATDCAATNTLKSFPALDFRGLSYERLIAFNATRDIQDLSSDWLIEMLRNQGAGAGETYQGFAMQPYQQLASVLKSSGFPDKANDILRAAKWRELGDAWRDADVFVMARSLLLWATIGWGIGAGYCNALLWVALFTAVGAVCLHRWARDPSGALPRLRWCLIASFGRFIPVPVGKEFSEVFDTGAGYRMPFWLKVYFLFHVICGYFIATCIAAGVAGLTQVS